MQIELFQLIDQEPQNLFMVQFAPEGVFGRGVACSREGTADEVIRFIQDLLEILSQEDKKLTEERKGFPDWLFVSVQIPRVKGMRPIPIKKSEVNQVRQQLSDLLRD